MALAHTILSALSVEPCSGYDMSKRFVSDGCYWKASQQQIYRELAKLEYSGMISSETIAQEGRPDKKLYYITDLGREHLRTWVAEPSEPTPIREDLLVKVMAGHLVPRQIILEELERRRQIHLQMLSDRQALYQQRCENFDNIPLEEQCFCLTLRRGIRYETEWVAWCDEAIQFLSKQQS